MSANPSNLPQATGTPPARRSTRYRMQPVWRRRGTWQHTGLVLLSAFALWLIMDATVLQHNAQVISPVGARRTAALRVLDPIAALARFTGLDLPVSGANEALGRTSTGGFVIPAVPTTTTLAKRTPTTTTTLRVQPTAAHPLRVLIIGDSIGEDLAAPLLAELQATGVATVWTDTRVGTGLTRLDYFNWVAELAYDVHLYHPQLIVGLMGANDPQDFPGPPDVLFNTAPWRTTYLSHASQLFSEGTAGGARLVWASIPTISDPGRDQRMQVVRDLQREAAAKYRVVYVDSDDSVAPGGRFAAYLKVGGQETLVRQADGIHLTTAGGTLLATQIMGTLRADLGLHLP